MLLNFSKHQESQLLWVLDVLALADNISVIPDSSRDPQEQGLAGSICKKRSLSKRGWIRRWKSGCCIMQHPVTTRELDFDLLAEVCYFYSGTRWSAWCQHLYNIKHLHPYGECIIKAFCRQLWKLSHILPKLHCNPQMRAGSQNVKSLA